MTGITQIAPKTYDTSGIFSIKDAADIVSSYGREGDTYIVHAAEGETVVPMEVLNANPRMKEMLFEQMREMGLEPERYVVGSELNSINPDTGQPEFFLKEIFSGLKDVVKKVAPIALAIAAPYLLPASMPLAFSSGLGSFAGNLISGKSVEDSLKNAVLTGAVSGVGSMIGGGDFFGSNQQAIEGVKGAIQDPGAATKTVGQNIKSGSEAVSSGIASIPSKTKDIYSTYFSPSRPSIMPDAKLAEAQKIIESAKIKGTPAATNLLTEAAKQPTMIEKFAPIAGTTLGVAGIADALAGPEKQDDIEFKDPREIYLANLPRYAFDDRFYGNNPFYQDPGFQPVRVNDGGEIIGPGTPTSDSIPAMLSDGEFVFNAKSVRGAGKGDRKKGAQRMYDMMKKFEQTAMA
jgi:hypothetical protein